jgi:Putative MetA-pathway of phenol degradation
VEREFTSLLNGYVEWFMIAPDTERAATANYLDAGLLYLLTDNVQLDTGAGCGLTSAALDFFLKAGISVRW